MESAAADALDRGGKPMKRSGFKALCWVVSLMALLLCGCQDGAAEIEALNHALSALEAQQAGQVQLYNLGEDGASLSAEISYAFENGAPAFTHTGWDAEGVKSEYRYQDGALTVSDPVLPDMLIKDTTQYRTLSEVVGIALTPLAQGEVQRIDALADENGNQIYTVVMKQTTMDGQEPYATVWGAKYRRYVVDADQRLVSVEVGDTETYTLRAVFAKQG